jgi:putative PIN family toxin of toxin-antitoxin system
MNIVLDTNVLLQVAFTGKHPRIVWEKLLAGAYTLCVTEDILYEYQEKVVDCFHNEQLANALINVLLNCEYVKRIETFFRYELIKADADDNKFVDCALACNAKYIVSEDAHFDVLSRIEFPRVDVVGLDEFIRILENR